MKVKDGDIGNIKYSDFALFIKPKEMKYWHSVEMAEHSEIFDEFLSEINKRGITADTAEIEFKKIPPQKN